MNRQGFALRREMLAAALLFISAAGFAQNDREIVKVNGTPIRQSEVLEKLWQRYGPETLEEMVDELLLRQTAQAKGIKSDAAEIDKKIARMRGQFSDPQLLEAQLKQYGSSLDKLRGELADQSMREKLVIAQRKISVSEGELQEAFKVHKDELGVPPAIHLRHMLVKTETEAKTIVEQIKGGADFMALAKTKSLAPTGKLNGGDYGFVSKGMLPPEIESVAFALKSGELQILPSEKGYHILQALEKRPAVAAEYAKVKNDLKELLLQEKIKQVLPEYVKELRQKADIQPQGE